MSWSIRLRGVADGDRESGTDGSTSAACPGCGLADQRGAPVCRNCGLPCAGPDDPIRGVRLGWSSRSILGPSPTTSFAEIGLVIAVILIGGALVTSGDSILGHGGRFGLAAPSSPSSLVVAPADSPTSVQRATSTTEPATQSSVSAPGLGAEASTGQDAEFSCDDVTVKAATKTRWQLDAVLAGSRRSHERVVLDLARRGKAKSEARVSFRWMSPGEARETFGLPRFDGRRGLLLTFGGPATTTGSQLIGRTDLAGEGMSSVSGIYRFVDIDRKVRVFVALRDRACARIRAPGFTSAAGSAGGPRIVLDLGGA